MAGSSNWPALPEAETRTIDPSEIDWARGIPLLTKPLFVGNQLFIQNVLQHLNLRETDDADFPLKTFIADVNGGVGRVLWADETSGSAVFTTAIEVNQDGTVDFPEGITTAARGVIDYVIEPSDNSQDGFSSLTALTNMSVTVPAGYPAGRLLKITGKVNLAQVGSAGTMLAHIRDETSTNLNDARATLEANDQMHFTVTHLVVSDGSGHVYRLMVQTTAGTGNIQTNASNPTLLMVEDIGPSA